MDVRYLRLRLGHQSYIVPYINQNPLETIPAGTLLKTLIMSYTNICTSQHIFKSPVICTYNDLVSA
jgi:hypothetical protein